MRCLRLLGFFQPLTAMPALFYMHWNFRGTEWAFTGLHGAFVHHQLFFGFPDIIDFMKVHNFHYARKIERGNLLYGVLYISLGDERLVRDSSCRMKQMRVESMRVGRKVKPTRKRELPDVMNMVAP